MACETNSITVASAIILAENIMGTIRVNGCSLDMVGHLQNTLHTMLANLQDMCSYPGTVSVAITCHYSLISACYTAVAMYVKRNAIMHILLCSRLY